MNLAHVPPTHGQYYTATVPDTYDIQPRAELVIRAMTNCTDPGAGHAPYDNIYIWNNPPVMRNTTMSNGKYMEATALLRHVTGSTENELVDESWRRVFLQVIDDYPWWGVDGGRILAWLGDNFRMEQDLCWRDLAKQAVKRLSQLMVHRGNYSYYPDERGEMPTGWDATWGGWVLQGLTVLYAATQDPDALDLASRLARFMKDHAQVFDGEAHFLARHLSDNGPALHFHHNCNALEGVAAFAAVAGDTEFGDFARSGYEWARSLGSPLVGFFPEYINDWPDDRPYIDCETCCTADMIQIAMSLSVAQLGDYWDDVDRYVRNQFAEMQLMDGKWIDQMVETLPPRLPKAGEDADRVSERIVGSFASWASANDWCLEGQPGTTFCCIGNGGRTLYYVWDRMIQYRSGTLRVNLLLNRASSWADVSSYVPYEGHVDVAMKAGCDLELRIPEWVQPQDLSGSVNGAPRQLGVQGRYALVGRVEAGDLVTVGFPIAERVVDTTIGNFPYTLTIKGNDVVAIEPSGRWYPFYQRAHYRRDQVLWVDRERYVPDQ